MSGLHIPELLHDEAEEAEMTVPQGYFLEYIPNRRERFWRKLYPGHFPLFPDLPGGARDCAVSHIVVFLSWRDRLRVLVSGRLVVRSEVATENIIGQTWSASHVVVKPPYERGEE